MNSFNKVFVFLGAVLLLATFGGCWIISTQTYGPDMRELPPDFLASLFSRERVLILAAFVFVAVGMGFILWQQVRRFAEPDYSIPLRRHRRHRRHGRHHQHVEEIAPKETKFTKDPE